MAKSSSLKVAAAVLAFATLGALQGARIDNIREAEAFYRWIRAAAIGDRLGWTRGVGADVKVQRLGTEDSIEFSSGNYEDGALFQKVAAKASAQLAKHEREGENLSGHTPTRLALHADGLESRGIIWDIASSSEMAEERAEFLALVRQRKLSYARDIDYAKMIEGEVGMFQMFLGFRKVAANFVWLEVDRLWHQGTIHRMIPLMKTCVLLDPQFIDAYLLGSWHLAYNVTAKMQATPHNKKVWNEYHQACIGKKNQYYYFAVDFLRDGISHNELDYRIYFDLGFGIYKEKLKDYANSVKYIGEALRQRHDVWVPRQLYICLELNGQYDEALQGWHEYRERFPDTQTGMEVAPRRINRILGLVYEERAAALLAEAENEIPPAAEGKRAEAAEHIEKARGKWREMDTPFSQSRLLRIEAVEDREKRRYYEAVGRLDKARYTDPGDENWFACSDMIIEIKQEAGIPLTVSEKKAVARKATEDRCIGEPT